MSRQFRSDDTSRWTKGFGNGAAGDQNISGTYGGGISSGGFGELAFTGTAGNYTATYSGGYGISYGGWPCILHQTQGTGAGAWEINYLLDGTSTTLTFLYPLQNTYTTGAQIVLLIPYNNVTITGTLTGNAWNGSVNGIIGLMAKETIYVNNPITVSSRGYRGGPNRGWVGDATNTQGEGYTAYGGYSTNANTVGGGGGQGNSGSSNGGGGGGHSASGQTGEAGGETPGSGGGTGGNAQLTSMILGGGGGAGGCSDDGGTGGGAGGAGGGIIIIIAKNIVFNNYLYSDGGTGGTVSGGLANDSGGGGGGAGGSILLKGQNITLGSNLVLARAGSKGTSPGPGGDGGNGGAGRVHLDYSGSYTGTTTPAIDVTQDLTIQPASTGGSFLFHFV